MGSKKTAWPKGLTSWRKLKDHSRGDLKKRHLRDMFRRDPRRFTRFSVEAGGLLVDYSRNLVTRKTMKLLTRLAREAGVEAMRERMFAGEHINTSEDRAVLHVALRSDRDDPYFDGDFDATAAVHDVLDRMEAFVRAVHSGQYAGHGTGRHFTDVVNIGIGGSDLGIEMASSALANYAVPGVRVHCVSNIDGVGLGDVLAKIDPATSLFVICSKTFTTLETMTNANVARAWIAKRLGKAAIPQHFVAASTNHEAMNEFGIHPDYRFGFWEWVGGRYSVWSAVGLSVALVTSMDTFRRLLAGGRQMDLHFRQAPMDENMPVMLAMLANWYNNFFGAQSQAILPYDNRLERFPAYLQQLQMESSGKSVRMDGKPVKCNTGMIIWGEAGNNAQHSFYQLLHQGTRLVPVDFLLPVRSSGASQFQQDLAIANCLAQSEALMDGYDEKGLESYRVHKGNNPSNLVLFQALTPETLGELIALYEHKVFVEGVLWGIDSFDQWGVELGKRLAKNVEATSNPSTKRLLARINRMK